MQIKRNIIKGINNKMVYKTKWEITVNKNQKNDNTKK